MSDLPLPCSALPSPLGGGHLLPSGRRGRRADKLSRGQMLPILVLFPLSADKDCKQCWHQVLRREYRACFAALPRCSPFVSLLPHLLLPLYRLPPCGGQKTGIYLPNQAGPLPQCSHEPQQGLPRAGPAWSAMGSWAASSIRASTTRGTPGPSGSPPAGASANGLMPWLLPGGGGSVPVQGAPGAPLGAWPPDYW